MPRHHCTQVALVSLNYQPLWNCKTLTWEMDGLTQVLPNCWSCREKCFLKKIHIQILHMLQKSWLNHWVWNMKGYMHAKMIAFYIGENMKLKMNTQHVVNLYGRLMLILERCVKVSRAKCWGISTYYQGWRECIDMVLKSFISIITCTFMYYQTTQKLSSLLFLCIVILHIKIHYFVTVVHTSHGKWGGIMRMQVMMD